ncbi:1418_t:CDS:2, partial [Cetraspora pellucida]
LKNIILLINSIQESQVQTPESQVQIQESQVETLEFQVQTSEPQVDTPESQIMIQEFQISVYKESSTQETSQASKLTEKEVQLKLTRPFHSSLRKLQD